MAVLKEKNVLYYHKGAAVQYLCVSGGRWKYLVRDTGNTLMTIKDLPSTATNKNSNPLCNSCSKKIFPNLACLHTKVFYLVEWKTKH